jgi:cardiolipin synthase
MESATGGMQDRGGNILNLPNTLTFGRFALIPIYLLIFFSELEYNTELAFLILLLAGLTDIVDGYLARKYKLVTQLGIMLDPLADKLMMIAVIVSFLATHMISWWAAAFFFVRDAGMILFSAFHTVNGKKTVPANILGKATTVLFYVAFLLIMFHFPYGETFLWGVIVLSFIASTIYYFNFKKLNRMMMF